MKLPFLKQKTSNEYFFSLVFREDRIEAFVFEKTGDLIEVINSQQELLEDTIDNVKFEEILDSSDKVISQAEDETKLPQEVSKTIFGLKESWVEDSKIKKDNLDILKKLCEGLGLTPIGFMTISEAVVGLLQKEEGAPPSAILADVGKNNVIVSLVKAGKIIETKQSEIHQSSAFTVDTLLKHFENMEILPSRIVLLNEDEELVQEFIGHQWSKSLPFLHLPQITNLEVGFMGNSLALGIAKQTGAEVVKQMAPNMPESTEPVEKKIEEKEEEQVEKVQKEEIRTEPQSNIEYVSNAAEFFGFSKKDVGKIEPPKAEIPVPSQDEEKVTEEIPQEVKEKINGRNILPAGILLFIPKVKSVSQKIFSKVKNSGIKIPNVPNLPFGKSPGLIVVAAILILVIFVLYYFLGLRATVVLSLEPRVVEKSQDVTFSDKSDFSNNIIKGDVLSVDEEGTTSTDTTGKKQTGDKAKGTVTIFNLTNNTITYSSQTKITSFNNLNFLTNSIVTVASSSGDASNPSPGKINVDVSAEKFGTDYNLPSGTKFTIGNVSAGSIVAKNDNAFSGGTKKDIIVVSKDDLQKLRDDLIKNLADKATADLQGKIGPNEKLVSDFVNKEVSKEDFDKDLDSEAKNVTLKGTVSYQTLAYSKNEFTDYLKTIFGPSDITFDEKNLDLKFNDIKVQKNNDVTANLNVKAKIYPQLDLGGLSKKIAGKSFSDAEKILSLPQVSNIKIKFSPNLFFLPKNLPGIFQNIKIDILQNG